jgi:intracellular sulfur oxidation DsrE/DsrF family protein
MKRQHFIHALVLSAVALSTVSCATAPQASAKAKVVIQVSDNDTAKWNLALNNANNILKDLGAAHTEIEIVAYGPGIGMLKAEAPVANRVGEAVKAGVKVVACENTMAAQKLTRADMNANVGYVPAGVVEIMTLQRQGWSYLRP